MTNDMPRKKKSVLKYTLWTIVFLLVLLFFVILCGWLHGRYQLEKVVAKFDDFPKTPNEFGIYFPAPPDNEKNFNLYPLPHIPFVETPEKKLFYELDESARTFLEEYMTDPANLLLFDKIDHFTSIPELKHSPDYLIFFFHSFDSLIVYRKMAQINLRRMVYVLDHGNTEEALRLYFISGNLMKHLYREYLTLPLLIANSVECKRLDGLQYILSCGELSLADLQRIMDDLDAGEENIRKQLPLSIKAEAAYRYQFYLNPGTHVPHLTISSLFKSGPYSTKDNVIAYIITYLNPLRPTDFARLLDEFHEHIEKVKDEYYDMKPCNHNYKLPYLNAIVLSTTLDAYITRSTKLIALYRCAKAAVAVKMYLLKNGELPQTLDGLVPEFLPAIPIDPFTGDSLKFRKGEQLLLTRKVETHTDVDGKYYFEYKYHLDGYLVFNIYSLGGQLDDDGLPVVNEDSEGINYKFDSGKLIPAAGNLGFPIIVDQKYIQENTASEQTGEINR